MAWPFTDDKTPEEKKRDAERDIYRLLKKHREHLLRVGHLEDLKKKEQLLQDIRKKLKDFYIEDRELPLIAANNLVERFTAFEPESSSAEKKEFKISIRRLGYILRGITFEDEDENLLAGKIYDYFDQHLLFEAGNAGNFLTEFLKVVDDIITLNPNMRPKQALGNIYTQLLIYLNKPTINWDGAKKVKKALENMVKDFEERIITEAQTLDDEMVKNLSGFILLKKIHREDEILGKNNKGLKIIERPSKKDEEDEKYQIYKSGKDYHRDFVVLYSKLLKNRETKIAAITKSSEAKESEKLETKPIEVKNQLIELEIVNTKVFRIHNILESTAPDIFKKQQAHVDLLISDILKDLVGYLAEAQKGKHGGNRNTQIAHFFEGMEIDERTGKVKVEEKTSVDALLEKLKALEDSLRAEDDNAVFRSGKNSKLYQLTFFAIEKLYNHNKVSEDSTIKQLYKTAAEHHSKSWFAFSNLLKKCGLSRQPTAEFSH